MIVSILVAVSENNVIGVDNQLPWHLPVDLKYFKQLTVDHSIIMGRKTFESIGKPLPNRRNLVITGNGNWQQEGVERFASIQEALATCNHEQEVFIIGGGMIYKESIELADKLYITRVRTRVEHGTAFFPEIDPDAWRLISETEHLADEKNKFSCLFEVYERA